MVDGVRPGDEVRLLLGGPPMTVVDVDGEWVICEWVKETSQLAIDDADAQPRSFGRFHSSRVARVREASRDTFPDRESDNPR